MMPAVGKTFTLAQWDPLGWLKIRERMATTTTTHSTLLKRRNGFTETLYFYDRPGGPPGNTVIWKCQKCGETEDKGHAYGCPNTPDVEVVAHAQEVCICAAVQMPDGYIVRGHRHHDCLRTAFTIPRYLDVRSSGMTQGFVTSNGRFVGRIEGLRLQVAAGIPSCDPTRGGAYLRELYSEDLY